MVASSLAPPTIFNIARIKQATLKIEAWIEAEDQTA